MRIAFGDCVFDADTRQLFRRGKPEHLPPKVFRLLEILMEQRPKAVSKEALLEAVWPGVYVSEGNLTRVIAELRKAIADRGRESPLIRTIHGFGYAFQATASPAGQTAGRILFKLIWGEREILLADGENLLGRDPASVVCVDLASVSRHHARILVEDNGATLEDLGSKNGTFLRNRRVKAPVALHDGDEIRIGTVAMVLRRFAPGGTTETARRR